MGEEWHCMENRVFILFFVILLLSFLFVFASSGLLRTRKKHTLRIIPIMWIFMFFTVTIPLTCGIDLIELQLFTDYTGGMRIEIHSLLVNAQIAELYIREEILNTIWLMCLLFIVLWMSGTAARLSFGVSSYFNSIHFLTKHSSECHDDKINKIFADAKKAAKVRRDVSLRVVKSDIKVSPCTCGTVFPTVFVGKDFLYEYSDFKLKLIFMHELTHVRQFHSFLKILTLIMTSIFGFIPLSKSVKKAVSEDCEHICDCAVIRSVGESAISEYMGTIIDIAERNIRNKNPDALISPISESGEFILKRYSVMKQHTAQNSSVRYALPLISVFLLINIFMMSSVSAKSIDNLGVDIASPLIERALCEYFGISDSHELTEKHISSIYSIEFALSDDIEHLENTDKSYAVSVILNEGLVFSDNGEFLPPPEYPHSLKFSSGIFPHIIRADMLECMIPQDPEENRIFRSIYTLTDCESEVPIYVSDDPDEKAVKKYLEAEYKNGRLDVYLTDSKVIDTRDIALFDDLRTLIFSDNLESSDETLYTVSDYAVIERNR